MYNMPDDFSDKADEDYFVLFMMCACCGRGSDTLTPCPKCGELLCDNCMPPFGAHTCEVDECYQLMM